ncbi:AAA family ATPase [Streptomyces puniciscabiei]|uniref:AAA family ATPase n=1 Tax=Streptomyces puniciscabiei TaxID=164348 RepID=UPI00332B7118
MGAPLERSQLPLGPLTVLVGPNAAGKSNVLRVFQFLADVARVGDPGASTPRRLPRTSTASARCTGVWRMRAVGGTTSPVGSGSCCTPSPVRSRPSRAPRTRRPSTAPYPSSGLPARWSLGHGDTRDRQAPHRRTGLRRRRLGPAAGGRHRPGAVHRGRPWAASARPWTNVTTRRRKQLARISAPWRRARRNA